MPDSADGEKGNSNALDRLHTIRLLMLEAATEINDTPRQISFKASIQVLRHWELALSRMDITNRKRQQLIASLRTSIADAKLVNRPGRTEPRCVKRHPKPFALRVRPRHEFVDIPHRSRYRANAA